MGISPLTKFTAGKDEVEPKVIFVMINIVFYSSTMVTNVTKLVARVSHQHVVLYCVFIKQISLFLLNFCG